MKIVIDTREQHPYAFETPSEIATLAVGDYSIQGLEKKIAIERKELNDLIGCLTIGRDRFERELHKGRALDFFAVVVEASLSDIANGSFRSNMNPKSAVQSLLAFSVRYRLPIFFCENREYGQRVTESLLLKYCREIEKQHKMITNGNQQHDAKPHTKFRMAQECQHPQR